MKEPILITGAARSGTSMVAGIIDLCGAFGGYTSPPNRNNAKGMFENIYVKTAIIKPYLRSIGMDPKCQYPLPDVNDTPLPINFREAIEINMIGEGYDGDGQWYYKDAKLCLMWKLWNKAFPDAKVVIVRRNTEDIVASCMRTGFMSAFNSSINQRKVGTTSKEAAWRWWVDQHLKRFDEMLSSSKMNVRVIYPERFLLGDYSEMYEVLNWLGLEWNPEVVNFIEPKLWKAKKKKGLI